MSKKAPQQSDQERTLARSKLKLDNFNKLAPKRMDKTLKALENLSRLANRNSYTYSPEQVQQIKAALGASINSLIARFDTATTSAKASGFTFKV